MFLLFHQITVKGMYLNNFHSNTNIRWVDKCTNRSTSANTSLGALQIMAKDRYSSRTHSSTDIELVDKYTSKTSFEEMFLEFQQLMDLGNYLNNYHSSINTHWVGKCTSKTFSANMFLLSQAIKGMGNYPNSFHSNRDIAHFHIDNHKMWHYGTHSRTTVKDNCFRKYRSNTKLGYKSCKDNCIPRKCSLLRHKLNNFPLHLKHSSTLSHKCHPNIHIDLDMG